LSFSRYLVDAGVPALLGLAVIWAVVVACYRGRFAAGARAPAPPSEHGLPIDGPAPPWNAWQAAKGLIVTGALLVIFLATDWPREIAALAGAGVLLCSRKLHSRRSVWSTGSSSFCSPACSSSTTRSRPPARRSRSWRRSARTASTHGTRAGCS